MSNRENVLGVEGPAVADRSLMSTWRSVGGLGLLQVATMASLGGALLASLFLLHHETEDYFTPLATYLSSFKVAVPPAAIFIASYAIAFVTGTALSDVPKAVLGFARNVFFQSRRLMAAASIACLCFIVYTAVTVVQGTPPAYEQLVKLLLSGSSDNLMLVRERVDEIRKVDPVAAARLGKIIEVFAERYAVNAGQKPLSGERARTFVRAIDAEEDAAWAAHPLRVHGLAEAYSLFGQSVLQSAGLAAAERPREPEAPYRKAVELYGRVASSASSLSPPILKASARVNTGNAHYYMKDYAAALVAWRSAAFDPAGQPNLSPWSNVIAALVMLDRPAEAVAEGVKARAWAERSGKALVDTYAFAGLLENTAFARLQTGDVAGAVADFATAHAFREDDLTRQNLALALVIDGRHERAATLLRQVAASLTLGSEPSPKIAPCVYLIWALAMRDAAPSARAVNLLAFLGERRSLEELQATTEASLGDILRKVAVALPSANRPCGSLGKIEAAMRLLSPGGPGSQIAASPPVGNGPSTRGSGDQADSVATPGRGSP